MISDRSYHYCPPTCN